MKIKRLQMGPILANGYVIYQKKGGACLIIDPGYRPGEYVKFLQEMELTPQAILATHLHDDHVGAAVALRDHFDIPICMHEMDALVWRGPVDDRFRGDAVFDLEGERISVLETPGHTKGSVCFMAERSRNCFSGDTLFDTDLGRTDLPGGSEDDMRHSVRDVLDKLDNSWHIWPGHEGDCTMRFVREHNEEFRALRDGKERSLLW